MESRKKGGAMQIRIFEALRMFVNPSGFFVRVEKDKKSKKYGYSFCRTLLDGKIKILAEGVPFAKDAQTAIDSAESMLKIIFSHGSRTYFKEGTYMYNHYNILGRVLPESAVLNLSIINELIFNLREAEYSRKIQVPETVTKPEATNASLFGALAHKIIEIERRTDA